MTKCMGNGLVEEAMSSIFQKLVYSISVTNSGLFPPYHTNYYHRIIVNEAYKVFSTIDWEGALAVPWGLVKSPLFLRAVSPKMKDPNNYESNGLPKSERAGRHLHKRSEYIKHAGEGRYKIWTESSLRFLTYKDLHMR